MKEEYNYDLCEICKRGKQIIAKYPTFTQSKIKECCIYTIVANYDEDQCIIACEEFIKSN